MPVENANVFVSATNNLLGIESEAINLFRISVKELTFPPTLTAKVLDKQINIKGKDSVKLNLGSSNSTEEI